MAVRLNEEQVRKIKADLPALSINQIAAKHGVGWATVKKIVAPESNGDGAHAQHRVVQRARARQDLAAQLTDAWWDGLTLEQKAKLMLEAL